MQGQMMPTLKDKTILITGGAQGVGEAAGRVFASQNAMVVLTDIVEDRVFMNAENIRQAGGDAIALVLDVTKPASISSAIDAAVDKYGRIDGLFHNAMSAAYVNNNDRMVTDLSDDVWDHIINLTLTGTFNVMRAVGREMLKHGSGSMVMTATVDALIAQAGVDAYSAAKGGVISLARSAAAGLSPQGIRINSICPGFIATPDQAAFLENPVHRAEIDKMHLIDIATPEDVAEYAAFLLSDSARCITGTTHMVDSGYSSFKGKMDIRNQISSN
ncbi:MAG: SDR family oxidoreductase [Amylibacter sp.]|jgi:NAD(P)-dependent dehydrogenase (short-subunit alcohol dehydrogenase family)|tara:strand:- start:4320 stop:5138 length:819 start_codon:yes stop_codon:yes gene_type:complete